MDGGGGTGLQSDSGGGVGGIGHLFLVGGFAESPMVQDAVREEFGERVRVIIPQVINYFVYFMRINRYTSLRVAILCFKNTK